MNPLRTGTNKHPTGQRLNISLAFANNKQRWQRAAFRINKLIDAIPNTKRIVDDAPKVRKDEKRTATLATNANNLYIWNNSAFKLPGGLIAKEIILMQNAVRYDYQLDNDTMSRTMSAIERILQGDILSGNDMWSSRFFMNDYIKSASEDGTTDSFQSALNITQGTSAEAALSVLSAEQQLSSPVYMDRLRMAYGRSFELMLGLTGDMKSQLRMTLTEGVARGVGIRDLKGMINKRLGIGMGRAERIARTEINHVYRSAYMNEADELNKTALKDDEWSIMQCHRSALSPTTRGRHAARHGLIFTMAQQQEWWSMDANAINCLCSTLDVLVNNKTGEILQQKMVDNMLKQRQQATGIKAPVKKVAKKKAAKKDTRRLSIPATSHDKAIENIQSKFNEAEIFTVKSGVVKEIMRKNLAAFDQLTDEYTLSIPANDFKALGINGNIYQPVTFRGRKQKARKFKQGTNGVVSTNPSSGTRQLSVKSASIKNMEAVKRGEKDIHNVYGDNDPEITTLTHEFGHLIFTPDYKGFANQEKLKDWFYNDFTKSKLYDKYKEAQHIVKSRYNQARKKGYGDLTTRYRNKEIDYDEYKRLHSEFNVNKDEIIKGYEDSFISIYALSDDAELVAEAFADYKLNNKPSTISMEIGKTIDKYMKKGK